MATQRDSDSWAARVKVTPRLTANSATPTTWLQATGSSPKPKPIAITTVHKKFV